MRFCFVFFNLNITVFVVFVLYQKQLDLFGFIVTAFPLLVETTLGKS